MNIFYDPNINEGEHTLSEEESRHVCKSLRLTSGDQIILINGKGDKYICEIIEAHPKKTLIKTISKESEKPLSFELSIAICPTKNIDRYEWFLEKATEIGISKIIPVFSEHSERKNIKPERLNKILVSAMKQSQRAFLPLLENSVKFNDLVNSEFEGNKFIAHCEEEQKNPLKDEVKKDENVLILIGPEGDFSTDEINLALSKGFKPVSLGESRLRTETAGLVACHTINLINQ